MKLSHLRARFAAFLLLAAWLQPLSASAHCEIPCGIYTDSMRIDMLREHYQTVEKSMQQIEALKGSEDLHQYVRWIQNKEVHGDAIQEIVTQYFMTQRVQPAGAEDAAYVDKITVLHELVVTAMKCKQSTDLTQVARLRELTDRFVELYFDAEARAHLLEHRGE